METPPLESQPPYDTLYVFYFQFYRFGLSGLFGLLLVTNDSSNKLPTFWKTLAALAR